MLREKKGKVSHATLRSRPPSSRRPRCPRVPLYTRLVSSVFLCQSVPVAPLYVSPGSERGTPHPIRMYRTQLCALHLPLVSPCSPSYMHYVSAGASDVEQSIRDYLSTLERITWRRHNLIYYNPMTLPSRLLPHLLPIPNSRTTPRPTQLPTRPELNQTAPMEITKSTRADRASPGYVEFAKTHTCRPAASCPG